MASRSRPGILVRVVAVLAATVGTLFTFRQRRLAENARRFGLPL